MFKRIILFAVAILAIFSVYVALQPSEMMVSRQIVIAAPAEVIFPYINNSKKANEWMPWKDSDPEVRMTYSGPEEGVGSRSSWDSKGQMGTGEALVVQSVTNQVVKTQLSYTKPFQMSQLAEISLSPVDIGTIVSWSVSGHKGYFFRLIGVFVNCDEMIGGEFEKGLSKLKGLVEGRAG